MRRKLGILFLIGITVLAGTPEAARQFDGLKSSLKNFTRASLWSGLIVYAQPVNDGKLPTPQIYYLMPTPEQQQQSPAPVAQQPLLADNNNDGANAAKPEARNNHSDEAASNGDATVVAEAKREAEDAAGSELALNHLPLNLVASHLVAPKPEKVRAYEEVAKNEMRAARKFKYDANVMGRTFAREAEAEKITAEVERLAETQTQLERTKWRTLGEVEGLRHRLELRVMRRHTRPERTDRIKVVVPPAEPRPVALLEMSSVGCEKTRITPEAATAVAAPLAKTTVQALMGEPALESGLPAPSNPSGNSWTLNCDTEPEQK